MSYYVAKIFCFPLLNHCYMTYFFLYFFQYLLVQLILVICLHSHISTYSSLICHSLPAQISYMYSSKLQTLLFLLIMLNDSFSTNCLFLNKVCFTIEILLLISVLNLLQCVIIGSRQQRLFTYTMLSFPYYYIGSHLAVYSNDFLLSLTLLVFIFNFNSSI